MKLHHVRHQYPVGQGFFHGGMVSLDPFHLRYVYDCGSEDPYALHREIHQFSEGVEGHPVDALFLSHMHSDHVNGLDQLLSRVEVKTVFLPYLSPISRLLLIAQSSEDGGLGVDRLSFLCDPTRWLMSRGVGQVVHVLPEEDQNDTHRLWNDLPNDSGPILPNSDFEPKLKELASASGEFEYQVELAYNPIRFELRQQGPSGEPLPEEPAIVMSCAEPIRLPALRIGILNWQFVMYVHPEGEREALFREAVQKLAPTILPRSARYRLNPIRLRKFLRSPQNRDRLAACYALVRKDLNLTSMSLYSGPIQMMKCSISVNPSDSQWHYAMQLNSAVGWLGAGDSNLKSSIRREHFLKHYSGLAPFIHTFALPHHGSRHNFHPALTELGRNFVVSVGANNNYHHPHREVQAFFNTRRLYRITEASESTFVERCELWPL